MKPTSFHISRRQFLQRTALLAAVTGLPAWAIEENYAHAATTRALGANEKPNVALIGCGGQGRWVAKQASEFANVVAVCDVDEGRATAASKEFNNAQIYKDFRKLMEREDVHAILNGTPDHWHTVVNMYAMQAGKDVYSEKPLTLTIDEGKRLVALSRKTGRIVQTGSQQRSDDNFRLACELVRNGRIGKLKHVITSLPAGPRRGPFEVAPVPAGLDWDFWQGQCAVADYVPQKCHGSFRYWWEYSGGTMTDWGAHHNDIALWGMGLERSGPVTVVGKALIEPIPNGFTAASEYQVDYTYANGVTQRCQSTTGNGPDGSDRGAGKPGEIPHGVRFEGADGWIFVTRGKIEASQPELLSKPLPSSAERLYVSKSHLGNFIECLRSRKQPICDVEIGHRSVSVCHLGVIAIRAGRKLEWDPVREEFKNDAEANQSVARPMRKGWGYDLLKA